MKLTEIIAKEENQYFAIHVVALFIVALVVEAIAPGWTSISYPAVILLTAASFMWNYPAGAIKSHGLFSEWLIEMRLLWLVVAGLISEYFIFGILEHAAHPLKIIAVLLVGLALIVVSHSRLQDKIVAARGFK